MLKKIDKFFHIPIWLFILLLFVVILRIPNFFEPYSYGDETIYLTLGQGVRQGLTLYKNLHDNKPPLLYLTAALAGNLFWFKAILLGWSLFGTILFFRFSEKLFPKIKFFPPVSTIIFAILTSLPFLEGNIVNAENFMIVPTITAFYLILFKGNSLKNIFLAGVFFSMSSMYKIPAVFDVGAVLFFWILTMKFNKVEIIKFLKKSAVLLFGISAPILLTFVYYWIKGAFGEYFVAAYLQNFGYLSSWRPSSQRDPFLVRNAPLLIRFTIVFIINIVLFLLRKKVDKKFLFIVSWLTLSIFGITLSERPYPHYLLQASAPVSILVAILFSSTSMLQVYAVFPLTVFFLVPLYYRFWHYRSVNYYSNFISMAVGATSKDEYLNTFGGRTKINYEIASVINRLTNKNDKIFVWEDSAQIYALSHRLPPIKYIAGYHINDFSSMENVIGAFKSNPPKVIAVFRNSPTSPILSNFIRNNYILFKESESFQIWRFGGEYSRYIIP